MDGPLSQPNSSVASAAEQSPLPGGDSKFVGDDLQADIALKLVINPDRSYNIDGDTDLVTDSENSDGTSGTNLVDAN